MMGVTLSQSEVLGFIEEKCAETLKGLGIQPCHAHRAAIIVSESISIEFGGQLVYFKKNDKTNTEERDLKIIEEYENGLITVGEIARKYGISIQRAYEILRERKK